MNARKVLVLFCCMLLFGSAPLAGAHEDVSIALRDAARNHLVDEVGLAVYAVETSFRFHKRGNQKTLGTKKGSGTAFGVTNGGLVLTAFHVVQAPVFSVLTPLGPAELAPSYAPPTTWSYEDGDNAESAYTFVARDGTRYLGEIVAINPEDDLALLSIAKAGHEKEFPFITFEREPLRHDSVVVIGTPFGFTSSVTEGIISNPTRIFVDKRPRVQTNATIHPGNSGGPLLLLRNHKAAGVVIENYGPVNLPFGIGIAFAVPASVAAKFLDDTLLKLEQEGKKSSATR